MPRLNLVPVLLKVMQAIRKYLSVDLGLMSGSGTANPTGLTLNSCRKARQQLKVSLIWRHQYPAEVPWGFAGLTSI